MLRNMNFSTLYLNLQPQWMTESYLSTQLEGSLNQMWVKTGLKAWGSVFNQPLYEKIQTNNYIKWLRAAHGSSIRHLDACHSHNSCLEAAKTHLKSISLAQSGLNYNQKCWEDSETCVSLEATTLRGSLIARQWSLTLEWVERSLSPRSLPQMCSRTLKH